MSHRLAYRKIFAQDTELNQSLRFVNVRKSSETVVILLPLKTV